MHEAARQSKAVLFHPVHQCQATGTEKYVNGIVISKRYSGCEKGFLADNKHLPKHQ